LAQAIGQAAIQQGYRVLYRETPALLDELAEAALDGERKDYLESLVTVPLLIFDDFGMRKLPLTAAEELLEIIMRRYERVPHGGMTSNRPVEDWGKLLGDAAAVSAMLDRLLHHGHVLKCGPRSWRTKTELPREPSAGQEKLVPDGLRWPVLTRPPLAGFEVTTEALFPGLENSEHPSVPPSSRGRRGLQVTCDHYV
jgi:hypothetical protein